MRLGLAHHFGWAVAVTAGADHEVVDRRRIELVEAGVPPAPIHHEGNLTTALHHGGSPLSDDAVAALVARVRASVVRASAASLDELQAALPGQIASLSLRAWPQDFPDDITVLRRSPYESHADSVMYRTVLAELAHARGWSVHLYDAKSVEGQAAMLLGDRGHEVLHGPRQTLGAPWAKDQRMALAATVLAG